VPVTSSDIAHHTSPPLMNNAILDPSLLMVWHWLRLSRKMLGKVKLWLKIFLIKTTPVQTRQGKRHFAKAILSLKSSMK